MRFAQPCQKSVFARHSTGEIASAKGEQGQAHARVIPKTVLPADDFNEGVLRPTFQQTIFRAAENAPCSVRAWRASIGQPPSSRRLILLTRFRRLSTAPSYALGIYKHLRILGAAFVFSGQRLCHRQKPNWLRLCLRARLLLSAAKALSSVGLVARSPAVLIALCERQIHGNGSIGLIRAPEPNGPMIAIHQDHLRMFSVATDG